MELGQQAPQEPGRSGTRLASAVDEFLGFLAGDQISCSGKAVAVLTDDRGEFAREFAQRAGSGTVTVFPRIRVPGDVGSSGSGAAVRVIPSPSPPLPSRAEEFDLVIVWHSIERRSETVAWCREVGRIVKPSGVVAVAVALHEDMNNVEGGGRGVPDDSPGTERGGSPPPVAISLEDVQRGLLAGGLAITKVALYAPPKDITGECEGAQLAEQVIEASLLLAVPWEVPVAEEHRYFRERIRALFRQPAVTKPTAGFQTASGRGEAEVSGLESDPSPRTNGPISKTAAEPLEAVAAHPPTYDWVEAHYSDAADQVLRFLAESDVVVEDRRVADVGCGDGLIDLGICERGHPKEMLGFDVRPFSPGQLTARTAVSRSAGGLPGALSFVTSEPRQIPAPSRHFDIVISWSAFEHMSDPVAMATEIHRILTPDGTLLVQLWPFFKSEHGSHLARWYPAGFAHLIQPIAELKRRIAAVPVGTDPELEAVADVYLNGITLGNLQRTLMLAGFRIVRVQLIVDPCHIPRELAHHSILDLAVGGVLLLAKPSGALL